MSGKKIASYSYLSWIRQGLVNQISDKPTKEMRASMRVSVTLGTDSNDNIPLVERQITKDVQLYGPGDVIGIQSDAVIRTEPRPNITNFEPNYLAFIEFYDEDFPWRYTPHRPIGNQLSPWLSLIVLREDEFIESSQKPKTGRPLPAIKVTTSDPLPFPDQLWAWAHVHMDSDLVKEGVHNQKIESVLNENPDHGYSRLLCPRRLQTNTRYHAFVVPVYEAGRLAGLGITPTKGSEELNSGYAWKKGKGGVPPSELPYYYRWYFRTGQKGDFEYLAKLLRHRPIDSRVGIRPMKIPSLNGKVISASGGILDLEGALLAPTAQSTLWRNGEAQEDSYQQELTTRINLGEKYRTNNESGGLAGKDPIITPPLYGRWHANSNQLSPPQDNWLHRLNLDPRYRAVAGLGTRVVQKNQEPLMAEAWRQVGDVLEANRLLQLNQLALLVSQSLYEKNLLPRPEINILKFCAPLHKKILPPHEGGTVFEKIRTSAFPSTVISPVFRRLIRPRQKIENLLTRSDTLYSIENLLPRVQSDRSILQSATPLKPIPSDTVRIQTVIQEMNKYTDLKLPKWVQDSSHKPIYKIILKKQFAEKLSRIRAKKTFSETQVALPAIDLTHLTKGKLQFGGPTGLVPNKPPGMIEFIPQKIVEDVKRKKDFYLQAMQDQLTVMETIHIDPPLEKSPLDVEGIVFKLTNFLDPKITIGKRFSKKFQLDGSGFHKTQNILPHIHAYPDFPQPMYQYLEKLSQEYLVPNIHLIPPNTISVLKPNPKFVEAFLIGLNHEMARELLWREYPTDQRGSYFRQFWEVMPSGYEGKNTDKKKQAEQQKDIPPIHAWQSSTDLGSHVVRGRSTAKAEKPVLVIRGDLLNRYPNTEIYAHRAEWVTSPKSGEIDKNRSRRLAKNGQPLRPTFKASLEPDITFLGFDITIDDAKGKEGDPGWFFVLKERAGEPRMGLDETTNASMPIPVGRKDVTWDHVHVEAGHVINLDMASLKVSKVSKPNPDDGLSAHLTWGKDSNSSHLACILTQDPMLVGIHAEVMLLED